jgi:hypothetical protein
MRFLFVFHGEDRAETIEFVQYQEPLKTQFLIHGHLHSLKLQ